MASTGPVQEIQDSSMLQVLAGIFLITSVAAQEYRLIFSHVIYRHGDRAPSKTFPKDKYQEEYWPMGWGQLTPKGVKQLHELGGYFRKRYSGFLSSNFSREEIYIRSSDRDRALESAQSNLAGLYPPSVHRECNAWMDWRPIPIHAVAKEDDYLLQTDADSNCPAYQKAYEEQSSRFIDEMNIKHEALFTHLKNQTGLKNLDLSNVGDVYGSINREKEQGWPVPDWVDRIWDETTGKTVFQMLQELRKIDRMLEYNSLEKTRYMSGFLTGDIVQRMKSKAAGTLKNPTKMVMYSAHEGTVIGLLFAMNVWNDKSVPYAGCLIIELHESITKPIKYFVTVHYRNASNMDPFPLLTTECRPVAISQVYCPLETFEESLEKVILYPVSKLEDACGMNKCAVQRNRASGYGNFMHMCMMAIGFVMWKRMYFGILM